MNSSYFFFSGKIGWHRSFMDESNSLSFIYLHWLKKEIISIKEFLKIPFFLDRLRSYETLAIALCFIHLIILFLIIYCQKLSTTFCHFPLLKLIFIIFFWFLVNSLFFFLIYLIKRFSYTISLYDLRFDSRYEWRLKVLCLSEDWDLCCSHIAYLHVFIFLVIIFLIEFLSIIILIFCVWFYIIVNLRKLLALFFSTNFILISMKIILKGLRSLDHHINLGE